MTVKNNNDRNSAKLQLHTPGFDFTPPQTQDPGGIPETDKDKVNLNGNQKLVDVY